jgi:hypothetical protein
MKIELFAHLKPQNKKEQPDHSDSKMPALISGIEKNI